MSAQIKALLPQRRNTFAVIVIVFVLGSALGFYYFYYIPDHRQRLNQYGFNILSAITRNIAQRNNDQVKLYSANLSGEQPDKSIKDFGDFKRALEALPMPPHYIVPVDTPNSSSDGRLTTVTRIKNDVFEYEISARNRIHVRVGLLINQLVGNILSYRHELFANYLILKHGSVPGRIVYQQDTLGLDERLEADSILTRRKGATFSQITDANIQGVQYKLFCYPFVIEEEHLVLVGMIKASDYGNRLRSIPVYLVYPLIILLLLIFISLPFLKIHLMGPYEQIRFADLTGLGLAVFGGVTVITMIIVQLILLARGYMEADDGVRKLSAQIELSMQKEVNVIRGQLQFLDTALNETVPEVKLTDKVPVASKRLLTSVYSRISKRYIPLFRDVTSPYYNFERVNWVDTSGMQRWQIQVRGDTAMFIKVKDRDYFGFFSRNKRDGRVDTAITVMAPVISWSRGDFVINFVKRSRVDTMLLIFTTKMYSLMNTVLPPGYGFCIIDNRGMVYVHSDIERSLKENFLDETDNEDALTGAINSRQDTTLNKIYCYGKEHTVRLHPLSQRLVMPAGRRSYFLVTYHNNDYMSSVNLRILAFSLTLTMLTFLLVLLWLLMNHGVTRRSILYRDPLAARFSWIIPKGEDTPIYIRGIFFMMAYLLVLLSLGVFGRLVFTDDVTFALGLLSPLNVLILLYAYRLYHEYPDNVQARWKTGLYFLLMLIYSLFIFWRLELGREGGGYTFWLFQGVLLLLTVLLWRAPGKREAAPPEPPPARLWHYSAFVLLMALCLGVLPMMVFTWYAHVREIEQSVKKQELSMAAALERRRPTILSNMRVFEKIDSAVKNYYQERCWKQGIYGILPCSIRQENTWDLVPLRLPRVAEGFYNYMTAYIDEDYDKRSDYPVLRQASDTSWYWEGDGNEQILHYMPAPGVYPDSLAAFRITIPLPPRFLFLGKKDNVTILVLAVLLVLGGLYALISGTVSRVFMLDFVRLFGARSKECPEDVHQSDEEIREMILLQRQKSAMFRSRWNRFTGRQRIILLDLVIDGLANFRNVMEISALTGEGQPLCICDGMIVVKDPVFRQFILEQRQTVETVALRKEYQTRSLWESLRMPLLVVIVGVGAFIFLTQEDISKKMLVLLTTLSGLLPLVPKLLGNFRSSTPPPKIEG